MPTYIFERSKGTLNTGRVEKIISKAAENTGDYVNYNPASYLYDERSTKEVWAVGAGEMSPNKLEKAATELGLGEHARLFVSQTILGAAKMLIESPDAAAE